MDDAEGLKELLKSATLIKSPAAISSRQEGPTSKKLYDSSFSSSLLESLQSTLKRSQSPSSRLSITKSIQEMHLDANEYETTSISHVKHPSSTSDYGKLIVATRDAIAYVLNDRKIRFIAQENAAMGLMDLHDDSRLPIIDIAWSCQDMSRKASSIKGAGGLRSSNSHLLASLSKGGELRIGRVYAETSSSLAYEPTTSLILPEASPARGLVWCPLSNSLTVFGSRGDLFILFFEPNQTTSYIASNLSWIEAVRYSPDGNTLYVAGLEEIHVIDLQDRKTFKTIQVISLLPGGRRTWLINNDEGVIAVSLNGDDQLMILPCYGTFSEILISISQPSLELDYFCQFDSQTCTLCFGSLAKTHLLFVNLRDLESPIVSAGIWPNESGAISVFASNQVHQIFDDSTASLYLYAYHRDSVKMHKFRVNWESTISAIEPASLPLPTISNRKLQGLKSGSSEFAKISKDDYGSNLLAALTMPKDKKAVSTRKESPTQSADSIQEKNMSKAASAPTPTLRENFVNGHVEQEAIADQFIKALQKDITPTWQKMVSKSIQENLAQFHITISKNLEKALDTKSKQDQKVLSELVTTALPKEASTLVQETLLNVIDELLLPRIESVVVNVVEQLSLSMSEVLINSQKDSMKEMVSEIGSLRLVLDELLKRTQNIPSTQELAQTVSNELRLSLSPIAATSASNGSYTKVSSIEALVKKGEPLMALVEALEMGDLEVLNQVLKLLNITELLPQMSPQIILSAIQQIGHELNTQSEVKLLWLSEIFTDFDPRAFDTDAVLVRNVPKVLEEVFSNLRTLFAETQSPFFQKQIKVVMRLVKAAATS